MWLCTIEHGEGLTKGVSVVVGEEVHWRGAVDGGKEFCFGQTEVDSEKLAECLEAFNEPRNVLVYTATPTHSCARDPGIP